ncbi:UPF0669 protein C6orf120 homolog isoform X1 [Anoplophora glabripennis]|uniref:UPF0669 protein C6orf120 homolog isoform X1 n=2 Tax=Anoplophora glabripennis TaxID=217634 RepID=UPI0008751B2C|nr:UPF0669 protein C6orf120 homolog isoform X1 [Anoplophora glabripennis]
MHVYCLILVIFVVAANCDISTSQMELLGRKEGTVGNENFSYYYIHHLGNILLSLKTNTGDADMYVSETNMIPTYDPDTYDLHSATCGQDVIEISSNFKSPISVGIFGHSAYDESSYTLEIFKNPMEDGEQVSSFLIIEEGNKEGVPEIKVIPKDDKGKLSIKSKTKKKLQNVSAKVSGIFSLFEIIELIFL